MKNQKKAIIISSEESDEPKLIQQHQGKKRLIRNDFEKINEDLRKNEIKQRHRKVIFDDDGETSEKNENVKENFVEQKKKYKLIKKQEIIVQAAQQEATSCPVCYTDLEIIQAAILQCGHLFCQKCIQIQCEKYQNNCPLCRKQYQNYTICIRGDDGEYLRGQLIKLKKKIKKQQYLDGNDDEENEEEYSQAQSSLHQSSFVQDSQYDAGDSFIVADDECCEECQGNEDMESMLFCKKCGCVVRHSYCQASNTTNKILCYTCRTYQQR
ncbi:unnamed protein product (macronuclear) [Paramecium tetraurelia]|uniref:RING-type domain-containing protein n=1 Tax=Paramecium tetraurelia TaxID=5888 RepID=A0CFG5_PARTE|nr:uncharacterized protein GSPATT00037971001 [Paramecium tetraurelia]CAK69532.1 unnamed protein product [Paramecium tetraurelia]|eukprot:XP_001436929.1 hypothetical protein (macronuclear) [Paramecium tetraurelia strain d4-2]